MDLKSKMEDIYSIPLPELKLVMLCSKLTLTEKEDEAIHKLIADPIDWDIFLTLAIRHQLYPIIYRCLSALAHPAVPNTVVSVLRQKNRENTSKTLQMTGELVRLLRYLDKNEIRAVVLKGLPMAYTLYGDITLRPSRDLDILVWPQDMEKARNVIEELGFRRTCSSFLDTPARLQNWMKANHHFEFWHKDREICVELHWRLGHHGAEIPLAEIENRLIQVKIAGQTMYILGAEELLLFLILHGASHAWFRLKWLCDIEFMLRQGGFSWERIQQMAKPLGVEVLLGQAVILSHKLLGNPMPDHISAMIMKDRKAQKLARMALPFITAINYTPEALTLTMPLYYQEKKYAFSLQDGWRRKVTLMCVYFSPAEADIELISLPDDLHFLYYLVRPFTWFSRRVSQLTGR